jgi:hypothetical protein
MSNNNFAENFYYIEKFLLETYDRICYMKNHARFFESLEFTIYNKKENADKIYLTLPTLSRYQCLNVSVRGSRRVSLVLLRGIMLVV